MSSKNKISSDNRIRCGWANYNSLYIDYHDNEWGTPLHDDTRLFEMLILEGVQAGLSWLTVLKKRENYRQAFNNFDAEKIARYSEKKIQTLLKDEGIIRNQLKIRAAVTNAKAFLKVQNEFGTFDKYIWQFTCNKTIKNHRKTLKDIPAKTKESDSMSKDLLKRGFKFTGSTICYAFMQATGLVNDHIISCWKY